MQNKTKQNRNKQNQKPKLTGMCEISGRCHIKTERKISSFSFRSIFEK